MKIIIINCKYKNNYVFIYSNFCSDINKKYIYKKIYFLSYHIYITKHEKNWR